MEKKCICFCRVSTQLQSLDEQKETVIANAIADGYKRDEIAIVEGKESAIKLKEEERQTILKEMDHDEIEAYRPYKEAFEKREHNRLIKAIRYMEDK